MAHFAQLDENNVVIQVIVINDRDCCDDNGIENEDVGIAFCQQLLGEDTRWKQTSYNRNMRVHYAGIGMRYNEDLDAFVHESPFPSWVLDSATANWVSPLGPEPTLTEEEINNNKYYTWDETLYQSDNTQGWILVTSHETTDPGDPYPED